eukprot:COSAG03_NODE_11378_length_596_cov_0.845070_2_plen_107_part_01
MRTDTRVSACKPGYYKTAGLSDVEETVNTIESTNDACSPCTDVPNRAGESILSCTTPYDTRVSYCAPEYYRAQGATVRVLLLCLLQTKYIGYICKYIYIGQGYICMQ